MLSDMKKKCWISLGKIPEFVHFVFQPAALSSTVFFSKIGNSNKVEPGNFCEEHKYMIQFLCSFCCAGRRGKKDMLAKQLNT